MILYRNLKNYVTLPGLYDTQTKLPITGATVSATLYDPSGAAVANATDITMTDVPNAPGDYKGSIEATFSPDADTGYWMVYTGTIGGVPFTFRQPVEVQDYTMSA